MIIQQTALVTLSGQNIQKYIDLGYQITKVLFDKYKGLTVKQGTQIEIKVLDLPRKSHVKVLCKCDECGKESLIPFYVINRKSQYLCKKCRMNSAEYKKKISLKNSGQNNGMFGITKENHPNWNPNLTDEERKNNHSVYGISIWKRKVKERDNYTCQKCGSIKQICAHHINNFAKFKEQRLLVENGITLCKDCHKAIHKQFGKFTTEKDLKFFILNF